ncbi:AzlD domain-containing protein [Rhodobacterales bacterium HKCCE3408]|nr:AzlD domain-containing protein [Rhodobacterales bacterium HKCCE3408]
MEMTTGEIWATILLLGIGTYLIRFSFLGLLGHRPMPGWMLRHLRYSAVAILPALIAPLVLWPAATGGEPDPARLAAAVVALLAAWWMKTPIWGMAAGMATLWILLALV